MSIEEQIKPIDWAKDHGVKSELVMKLLRDNGRNRMPAPRT